MRYGQARWRRVLMRRRRVRYAQLYNPGVEFEALACVNSGIRKQAISKDQECLCMCAHLCVISRPHKHKHNRPNCLENVLLFASYLVTYKADKLHSNLAIHSNNSWLAPRGLRVGEHESQRRNNNQICADAPCDHQIMLSLLSSRTIFVVAHITLPCLR